MGVSTYERELAGLDAAIAEAVAQDEDERAAQLTARKLALPGLIEAGRRRAEDLEHQRRRLQHELEQAEGELRPLDRGNEALVAERRALEERIRIHSERWNDARNDVMARQARLSAVENDLRRTLD